MGDQSTPRDSTLYKNQQNLADYLEFVDIDEFTEWLDDRKLFKGAYDELLECCIIPEEESTKAANAKRGPGPALSRVERRLVEGELFMRQTYSCIEPDKAAWHPEDHYARFLWRVRYANEGLYGIFNGKDLSVSEMNYRVWQVLQRCISKRSPSRQAQSSRNASDPAPVVSPMPTASVQDTVMAGSAEPSAITDERTPDLGASSSSGDIFSQQNISAMAEAFEKSKQPGNSGNLQDLESKSRVDPMDVDEEDDLEPGASNFAL
ncbi:hypothetical protein G7Y79_00024g055350 [Physcia stellaris]|nr:hypothetical protein G7Y79_00024g055350 [Physcia stellaris]